jgi:hypothetical protein
MAKFKQYFQGIPLAWSVIGIAMLAVLSGLQLIFEKSVPYTCINQMRHK